MRLSLIVATRGRTEEFYRLFDSLVAQSCSDFEVIIADQNDDERLAPVVEHYKDKLAIDHIRTTSRGHSAGINVGLKIAKGDIVVFPDDDCWYRPGLLEDVVKMFDTHPDWDGVTGCEAPSEDAALSRRFDSSSGRVTKANVWRRHISFTMFFRREKLRGLLFDERLGVGAGTIWGSGEETDFLLRFIKAGNNVQYDPTLAIFHPDWGQGPYNEKAILKARAYAMGMGRVLRTHRFPSGFVCQCLIRPLGGVVLTAASGNISKARYYWASFVGRFSGWIGSPNRLDSEGV